MYPPPGLPISILCRASRRTSSTLPLSISVDNAVDVRRPSRQIDEDAVEAIAPGQSHERVREALAAKPDVEGRDAAMEEVVADRRSAEHRHTIRRAITATDARFHRPSIRPTRRS